jgi:hypothetical protein
MAQSYLFWYVEAEFCKRCHENLKLVYGFIVVINNGSVVAFLLKLLILNFQQRR